MPVAAGPFVADAFTDSGNGRGITWGLSHFKNAARDWSRQHSVLTRFDCDLSLDVHDPEMKKSHIDYSPEHHYKLGLNKTQRARILEQNRKLRHHSPQPVLVKPDPAKAWLLEKLRGDQTRRPRAMAG